MFERERERIAPETPVRVEPVREAAAQRSVVVGAAASCVINVDLYATAIASVASGEMTPAEALDDVGG